MKELLISLLNQKAKQKIQFSKAEAKGDFLFNTNQWSYQELAQRWRWSKSKVHKFVNSIDKHSIVPPDYDYWTRGFIYLAYCKELDVYKIGYTSYTPRGRIKQVENDNIYGKKLSLELISSTAYDTPNQAQWEETKLIKACRARGVIVNGNEWVSEWIPEFDNLFGGSDE